MSGGRAGLSGLFRRAKSPPSSSEASTSSEPISESLPGGDNDEAQAANVSSEKRSWLARLTGGLTRSSRSLGASVGEIFSKRKLDEAALDDLEDVLLAADLGIETTEAIRFRLAERRYDKEISPETVKTVLAEEVARVLKPLARPLTLDTAHRPHVILVVGVNGTGKTTTIGKLAARFQKKGHRVTLVAGDTFRAAAVEQLQIWGTRTGAEVIARDTGADAAGLVFDAVRRARENGSDALIIDTAGRLQNRNELMDELRKIVRIIKRHDETAPHTVLLTLDATTGQNALNQVEVFSQVAGVTGLAMTKLDGTARGGILVAVAAKHNLPIHMIGVGEGIDDLAPFEAESFARALVGLDGEATA